MTGNASKLRRLAAWAGMIGPVMFTVLVIIESLLRPGYSQIHNFVSDLGIGKYSFIQNTNFILFGSLSVIFAAGLKVTLPEGNVYSKMSVWATVVFGFAIIFAGIALITTGSTSESSSQNFFHVLSSMIAFLSIIAAQLFVWGAIKDDDNAVWGRYGKYTIVSGIISMILLFGLFSLTQTASYSGATERIFLAVPWIWIEVSGIMMYRKEK